MTSGPDPPPIRGCWTIHHVSGQRGDHALVTGPMLWRGAGQGPVEVVPVPDEAAIERGAKADREHRLISVGWDSESRSYGVWFFREHAREPSTHVVTGFDSPRAAADAAPRIRALAVLRAALEAPEGGPLNIGRTGTRPSQWGHDYEAPEKP